MTFLYKGVGVGTFHHTSDLRTTGIVAAGPTANAHVAAMVDHIHNNVLTSPFISTSRSAPVAVDYALNGGSVSARPTKANPAHVYRIDLPGKLPGNVKIFDPVQYISDHHKNPLINPSYHHNGAPDFLLALVDPVRHAAIGTAIPASLPGSKGSAPKSSDVLVAIVNALRDAEIMILGPVLSAWVTHRYDIF